MNTPLHLTSTFGGETLAFSAMAHKDSDLEIFPPEQKTEALQLAAPNVSYADNLESVDMNTVVMGSAIAASALAAGVSGYALHRVFKVTRPASQESKAEREAREAQEAEDNRMGERTLSHAARSLILSGVLAHVTIQSNPDVEDMQVRITGKEKHLKGLLLTPASEVLDIRTDGQKHYMPASIFGKGLDSRLTQLVAKGMDIEFYDESDVMQLTAVVPEGSYLTLARNVGDITAAGSYEDVRLSVAYKRRALLGRTTGLSVKAGSEANVTVDYADGPVAAEVGYKATVNIADGKADSLNVKTNSESAFQFDGVAEKLKIRAGYMSQAEVTRANGEIDITANTEARVIVGSGVATTANITVGYKGGVTYNGAAESANLKLNSEAEAQLARVDHLVARLGYRSAAKVLLGDIQHADITTNTEALMDIAGSVQEGRIVQGYKATVSAAQFGEAVNFKRR